MVTNAAFVSQASPENVRWGHQVTHKFLYIPECPVPLLGRDLLSKLGAQVTFPPHKSPTLRVGSTTHLLFLSVTPQDEWRLHHLPEGKPDGLNSGERELTQQFPEVWAEDNTPRLAKQVPVVTELKPDTIMSGPSWACQTLLSRLLFT